ncbi:MAG: site-2 protease family protein, partial [Firmicutes bacterium]|nr:site-2 protease family protein [Bacillota bacterium]
ILINVPITLIALTGHEFAHGWVSSKLGDPTPKREGRLTLNPLAHLDLVGTLLMILTGFGWAKPVRVDPRYYKNTKKGMALTAAAGPLANLVMAFLAMLIYAVILVVCAKLSIEPKAEDAIGYFAQMLAVRNLCFMVFNIIPIPPLDGAKVLGMFLPNRAYYTMLKYERYSMLLIMVLSLTGVFSGIIGTGVSVVMSGIIKLLNAAIKLIL